MVFIMCHHLSVKTWLCCHFSAEAWRRLRIVQSRWRRSVSRQGIERILVKTKTDLKRQGAKACKRCQTFVELLYLQVSTTQFCHLMQFCILPDNLRTSDRKQRMQMVRLFNAFELTKLEQTGICESDLSVSLEALMGAAVPGEVFSLVLAPISARSMVKRRRLSYWAVSSLCKVIWIMKIDWLTAPFFPQQFQQALLKSEFKHSWALRTAGDSKQRKAFDMIPSNQFRISWRVTSSFDLKEASIGINEYHTHPYSLSMSNLCTLVRRALAEWDACILQEPIPHLKHLKTIEIPYTVGVISEFPMVRICILKSFVK